MSRSTLTVSFFVFIFMLSACSSPWNVIREAKPNPFGESSQFKAMQVDFSKLQFDGDPQSLDQKKFKADKSFMARDFQRALLNGMRGKGVKIFTGKAVPNIFVIRPMMIYINPGSQNDNSKSKLKVQLLKNNKILDVITFEVETKPEPSKNNTMSVSGRMRSDGQKLGELVAKYLIKRLGK